MVPCGYRVQLPNRCCLHDYPLTAFDWECFGTDFATPGADPYETCLVSFEVDGHTIFFESRFFPPGFGVLLTRRMAAMKICSEISSLPIGLVHHVLRATFFLPQFQLRNGREGEIDLVP